MDKNELLEQLCAVKHMMERKEDRGVVLLKRDMLDELLKSHRFIGFSLKRDMKARRQQCSERSEQLNRVIKNLSRKAVNVIAELPSGLITSREYVDAAIDDIIMGRASNMDGVISCYNSRRDIRRESWDVQKNKMETLQAE